MLFGVFNFIKGKVIKMAESQILYDQIPVVANLNRVEGFDPRQYLRLIPDDRTGEAQYYLDVKFRKLWFRLAHPTGKIAKKIIQLTDSMAAIEARVYLDVNDSEDHFVASAFAQRSLDGSTLGAKFLESAETAAIGRALADAGFGVQFCDVAEGNDPAVVDAGVKASVMNAGAAEDAEPAAPTPPVSTGAPATAAAPPALPAAPASNLVTPPVPSYTKDSSVEIIYAAMTLDEAKAVVVDFKSGALKGKTLAQVAFESPKDLRWFVDSYNGHNNLLKAGAKKLLDTAENKAS